MASGGPSPKRRSMSSPSSTKPSQDEDIMFQRLLEVAGLCQVTDHVASIEAPLPSRTELHIIHSVLPPSMLSLFKQDMVSRLLGAIKQMELAEDHLRRANIKAQKLWRALDPTVSPICQLPEDIVILIFEHGVADEITRLIQATDTAVLEDQEQTRLPLDQPVQHPSLCFSLLVSHVCSFWRTLALSRSSLWTLIRVSWSINQISTFLTRSKNHPVHLDMLRLTGAEKAHRDTLDLLERHVTRWRSLSMSFGAPGIDHWTQLVVDKFTRFIFGNDPSVPRIFPQLQTLYIASSSHFGWLPLHTASATFPLLETLRFAGVAAETLDNLLSNVRKAQIDLSGLFTWNWRGLGHASNLVSLTIRSSSNQTADEENELEGDDTLITLPRLMHLCIDTTPPRVFGSFLMLLRAPNLKQLSVNLRDLDNVAKRRLSAFAFLHPSVQVVQLFGSLFDSALILSGRAPPVFSRYHPLPDPNWLDILAGQVHPFPLLRELTLANLDFIEIDENDVFATRHLLASRTALVKLHAASPVLKLVSPAHLAGDSDHPADYTYLPIRKLRLQRPIFVGFKQLMQKTNAKTMESIYEGDDDDDDYDSGLEGTATEAASTFDESEEEDELAGDNDQTEWAAVAGQAPAEDHESDDDEGGSVDLEIPGHSISLSSSDEEEDEDQEDDQDEGELVEWTTSTVPMSEDNGSLLGNDVLSNEPLKEGQPSMSFGAEGTAIDGEQWLLTHVEELEIIDFDWRSENP